MSRKPHVLKICPLYLAPLLTYKCHFQFRKNDRDFKVGDILILREWDQEIGEYTNREEIKFEIDYILQDARIGIPEGYCVLGISDLD